jgi:predicted nucleotidyltransferase
VYVNEGGFAMVTRDIILQQLIAIEKKEQVRILYACESGSRAWGFASRDSDYDVRFIYVHKPDWYLSIFDRREVIEQPISELLDVNGWDLRKALNLFRKSNPPLLEWLQSPIRYYEKYSAAEQIRQLTSSSFSPKSCMHHYLNMAKGNFREYLQGDQVKIKKYFYVLRPILAAMWIERYNTMPPIEFEILVERILEPESELKQAVLHLLERKKAGDELNLEPKVLIINAFIGRMLTELEIAAGKLGAAENNQDTSLDDLFRSVIREVWLQE